MSLYAWIVALHVVIAIVGVGLVGAIPVAASRRSDPAPAGLLDALFRYTRWSLAGMLVTGVLVELQAGGVYHGTLWFRASFALLLFLGFAHARGHATLRKARQSSGDIAAALPRVARWGWIMALTVVLIAVLMEVKSI